MRLKLFRAAKGNKFEVLEAQVNAWLADHPSVSVTHVHRLCQPTFGWGYLAIAVWYSEA